MRALLAVLLLTGLATAYAQDLEWFEVGPHLMSNTYSIDGGCAQDAVLNVGSEDQFYLSFNHGLYGRTDDVLIIVGNPNEPVWEGYGSGEWISAADGMMVNLIPPGETYTRQDGQLWINTTDGVYELASMSVPAATFEDRFFYFGVPSFGFGFLGLDGRFSHKHARINEPGASVVAVFQEQFVPECLGDISTVSTPFPRPTSTRGSVQIENALGFSFLSVDKRETDWGDIEIYGEIKNNNSIGMDVKIEIILRDANGRLLDSVDFLVGNLSNIRAGGSRAFSQVFDANPNFASIDIRVIDSHEW